MRNSNMFSSKTLFIYLSSLRAEHSATWKTLLPFQRTLTLECLEHPLPSTTGEEPQTPLQPKCSIFHHRGNAFFQGMKEHASYTAIYQQISFGEHFFLQKCISLLLSLHSSTHLHSPASVGFPRNKTPSSTMSQIPLLSSSIHRLEIEKEELR